VTSLPIRAGAEPGDGAREVVHDALLRELAARPGGAWVTCAGASMEPTIRRGERVRVEACTRVRSGEVALFAALRGGYVLHRVVFAVPGTGWFVHVGDAGSGDGPGLAHVSRLVGRAVVARRRRSLSVWVAGVRRVGLAAARLARRATLAR
jgi:hypothetical protein